MIRKLVAGMILAIFTLSGCTAYKSQYVPFRPPQGYLNYQVLDGVSMGAEAYATQDDAENAFGFDIKGAGLLPVQLVMDNKSGKNLELVADQTFLVDGENRYWPVVPTNVAVDRRSKSSQLANIGKGAGKGALLGAAGGAILGAAIGIVAGENVGSALGKGAALGAAGGAVVGGVKEGTSGEQEHTILGDIRTKGLEGKTIPPENLANGFIFFPGEAPSARELRLQYREVESGKVHSVVLRLK